MNTSELYALSLIKGVGNKSIFNIIKSSMSIDELTISNNEILSSIIKGSMQSYAIKQITTDFHRYVDLANEDLMSFSKNSITLTSILDNNYPIQLKQIDDPPIFLFSRGNSMLLSSRKGIAIIGTRDCTSFGGKIAGKITKNFVASGFNIISGLATGIDSYAHSSALDNGGKTTAVLIDINEIYPPENKTLCDRILNCDGVIVAENRPGTKMHKSLFVQRDRIQSGLSLGVVPIETDIKGGTMHTVSFAKSQGRVIICPDLSSIDDYPIKNDKARGILYLLESGSAFLYNLDTKTYVMNKLGEKELQLFGDPNVQKNEIANPQLKLGI